MTIFLTLSALTNIGLGYWLATYVARERARASAGEPVDALAESEIESHEGHGLPIQTAAPVEMAAVAPPTMASAAPILPAASASAAPIAAPVAAEAPELAATPAAPELETEVLAGIEEFRNQLAQMKATPDAAESVAAPA